MYVRMAMLGLAWLAAAAGPAGAAGWLGDRSERADALVGRFLERIAVGQTPALSVAVGIGGQPVFLKGFGEAAPGVAATEHTVYHIGSLSKQMTAAAVLDLIDRRARLRSSVPLDLDLGIERVFEGLGHWSEGGQRVTVRNLLTMTSNLPNFTREPPPSVDPWGEIAAPQLLSEIKRLRPTGWPGTFEYSNTCYFLLAEIIEEAVEPGAAVPRSEHEQIRRAVFAPAGMHASGFIGDYAAGTMLARPIHRRRPAFNHPNWLKGSADIASTAADVLAWNRALMADRILSRSMRGLMFSDGARVTPEVYYGMGWYIEHRAGRDVFQHTGHVPGYTATNLIVDPGPGGDWVSVTVLLNVDQVDGVGTLAEDLARLALGPGE